MNSMADEIELFYLTPEEINDINDFLKVAGGGISLMKGELKSPNYVQGESGWKIDSFGNAEFKNIAITGGSISWSAVDDDDGNKPANNADVTSSSSQNVAWLNDAGAMALRDDIRAIDCDTTIISGGKIITGLLTASNIQTGVLTGLVVQTSPTANSGVKMSSALGGIVVYGETLEIRDTSGNLYGKIGGAGGYYNITSETGRNILIDATSGGSGDGIVFSASPIAPLTNGGETLGTTSFGWKAVYFGDPGEDVKYIQMADDGDSIDCNHDYYVSETLSCAKFKLPVGTNLY